MQSDPIGILRDYSNPQMQVALNQGGELVSTGGLNHLYGYAEQNAINATDPLGLFPGCRLVDGGRGFDDYYICDRGGPDHNNGDASAFPEATNNQCTIDCITENSNSIIAAVCGSSDIAVSLLSKSARAGAAVGGSCQAVLSVMRCSLNCSEDEEDCE